MVEMNTFTSNEYQHFNGTMVGNDGRHGVKNIVRIYLWHRLIYTPPFAHHREPTLITFSFHSKFFSPKYSQQHTNFLSF